MAKKRLSSVAHVATPAFNDCIVINTAAGKTVQLSLTDFNSYLLSGVPISGYEHAVGGGFYAPNKYIGTSGSDGSQTVLLIAPFQSLDITENWCGCIGKFIFTRGGTQSGLLGEYADIALCKAYNSIKGHCYSSWGGVKVGYCSYGGQLYLALRFPLYSYFGITFSGKYSGNCVFKSLPLTAVSGWTDI